MYRYRSIFLSLTFALSAGLLYAQGETSVFSQENAEVLNTPKFVEGELPFAKPGTQDFLKEEEQEPAHISMEDDLHNPQRPLADYLREFEGRWVGTLVIRTMQGKVINRIDVEQQYWWSEEDLRLEGLAVFDDAGILRYAQSINYIKDGKIYSEVEEAHQESVYQARIEEDGTLVWLPLDRQRALDHQMKQRIYSNENGMFMKNSGYERYKRGVVDTMLLLEGNLKKDESEEETSEEVSMEEAEAISAESGDTPSPEEASATERSVVEAATPDTTPER